MTPATNADNDNDNVIGTSLEIVETPLGIVEKEVVAETIVEENPIEAKPIEAKPIEEKVDANEDKPIIGTNECIECPTCNKL